jgi:PAS domain S-box-containing protein
MSDTQRRERDSAGEIARLRARVAELECILEERRQAGDDSRERERERAEARLWLLSSVVQQTSEGLAVVNLGGNLIFANDAFARMHGYAPEELIGKHISILHTAEQMSSVDAANRALRETGEFNGEIGHARRDGSVFPALMHNTLLRDECRNIIGVIGTARDITDVKVAEKALRESERRYRTLFEASTDAIFLVAPDGRVLDCNASACEMLGYSKEEMLALSVADLVPDDVAAALPEVFATQGAWGRLFRETLAERKDGSVFPVELNCRGTGFDGQPLVVVYCRDITRRRAIEEALRQSEERYRVVTENALIGVYIYQRGRMLYVNPAFSRIFGYEPEEIARLQDPMVLVHPEDRALAAEHIRRRLDGETEAIRYRFRGVRKDGTLVQCEAFGRSIVFERERSIIGAMADITDRANSEAQRERLAQAIENSSEGIGIWDGQWRLIYGNAALARILGLPRAEDAAGRGWMPRLDDGASMPHTRIAEALECDGTWSGRLTGTRPDGERVPLAVAFTRFVATTGDPMIVGSIRDTSTEERYLAQIRKLTTDAERRLEAEKARISRELHDELGQLLTALNLDLAWVGRRLGGADDAVRDRVSQMQDVTHQVTDRVRYLSKSLHPPVLDHEGLVATVRSQAAEFERRAGVACRVTIVPGVLKVREPLATTVFRIVQEALTNVARHARASRCEVSLERRRGVLRVSVRDDGVGATPTDLMGTKSLGVVGMRERAAAAGGTLSIESTPGDGVCVKAELPWQGRRKPRRS